MKTDYKYGLGKDRRELSFYQTAEWCRHIAGLPKPKVDFKGEKHPRSRLKDEDVLWIRSFPWMPRSLAKEIAGKLKIAAAYVYQLRKKVGGCYKKWPHLR